MVSIFSSVLREPGTHFYRSITGSSPVKFKPPTSAMRSEYSNHSTTQFKKKFFFVCKFHVFSEYTDSVVTGHSSVLSGFLHCSSFILCKGLVFITTEVCSSCEVPRQSKKYSRLMERSCSHLSSATSVSY